MEFEEILIENFGTIEHVKLKLNQPGLILIQGINNDAPIGYESNGAGKSLLFDAICWCLWDKTPRKRSGDEVVRRKYGKDCCVQLKIRDDKTTYLIARHRKDTRIDKPNDLRLYVNGVEKGKKMKHLQEVIDGIVGFDFDTFCAMMPGAGTNVATLTDTKIKELLEKLLQTEQLSSAYSAARDRLKVLETDLTQTNAKYANALQSIRALEKEVAQLRDLESSFETNKLSRIKTTQERIDNIVHDIAECQAVVDREVSVTAMISEFQEKVQELVEQIQAIEKPAKLSIENQRAAVRSNDAQLIAEQARNRELHVHIGELKALTGKCPICETAITPEHIDEAVNLLQFEAIQREGFIKNLTNLNRDLNTGINREINEAAAKVAVLQGMVDANRQAITDLQKVVTEARNQAKLQERLRKDLKLAETELAKVQAEQHNFSEIFKSKQDKAVELVDTVCSLLNSRKQLESEAKLCRFWVEGFSPAGLRSYMLDYVTPVLNDRAAYYARVLTGEEMKVTFSTKTALKSGDIRDKFQITVEQSHGGDAYDAASKGEKARADLVIAMALGDLATFRTTKQLPWRFLDEPFESIDDRGNESVVNLLNDQKSRFKTVFVVTHKPAFKKLFNQRIVMVKENDISKLVQDSNT